MSTVAEREWLPFSACPCGCEVVSSKLAVKSGHVRGCKCRPCIGKRNRKAGQAAEAKRHKLLGGEGRTPRDDLHHAYSLNISVEDKHGAQVPASIVSFVKSEFYRHAQRQATKKIPVGSDAWPAVFLHPARGGHYIVIDVPDGKLR